MLFCSASCVDFGSSGSGVVRQWNQSGPASSPVYQYSFAGPLTMSKGCDLAIELKRDNTPLRDYIYRGSNPAVVTDATCYMDWIAEQYQLRLENTYESKESCSKSSGNKEDINKEVCWTSDRTRCDWTKVDSETETLYDSCRLYAEEGIAKNVFQCIDDQVSPVSYTAYAKLILQNRFSVCPNNCRGVNPNSIVGGGTSRLKSSGSPQIQMIK